MHDLSDVAAAVRTELAKLGLLKPPARRKKWPWALAVLALLAVAAKITYYLTSPKWCR